ncbi:MAG: hypothetical protein AB7E47_14965 [Desulfovibrionaceae bacterium]
MQDAQVSTRKNLLVGWIKLIAALGAIWSFMIVGGPWLERHYKPLGDIAKFIDRSGIETNMIWYSEIEVSGEAELGTRSAIRFMPTGPAAVAAKTADKEG